MDERRTNEGQPAIRQDCAPIRKLSYTRLRPTCNKPNLTDRSDPNNTNTSDPNENVVRSKKKRERRSKELSFQRNYVCGCGKSYLSYAALYTHAKTKHEGVFPEGTATLHKKKQSKPKRDDWTNVRINSEYQRTYDFNRDFRLFLDKIPGSVDLKEKRNKNLIEDFPCEIFREQTTYRQLLVTLEQIRKELIESYGSSFLSKIDVIIFEINNSKTLSCDQVMALFLIYSFRFISKQFYKELVFLFISLRIMLNEFGWNKLLEISESLERIGDFCESQSSELIPDLMNPFIMDFFMQCIGGDRVATNPLCLKFWGQDPQKLLWAIVLLKYFCQWLFIHRFTKGRIEIQRD